MKLNRLIEILTELQETLGGSAEVKIAEQPEYPFEYTLLGVVDRREFLSHAEDEDRREHWGETDVVLVAGNQIGYTSRDLWDNIER